MHCRMLAFAVALIAFSAFGSAEHAGAAVNIISGITAGEEYCLSVQGGTL